MDPTRVSEALGVIRDRLRTVGRPDITVVAITKGFGPDAVRAVVAAGCRDIGESYAQEAVAKLAPLLVDESLCVHFVGHLQTNKVRLLAPVVTRWDSVDRSSVVDELARRVPGAQVLLQVNTTGEQTKAGVGPEQLPTLLEHAITRGLEVHGLMTVGPTEGGPEAARAPFRLLRRLVDEHGLEVCSMGMSADLEVAAAEGATEVRVGTAIFGARPPRDHPHGDGPVR